MPRRAISLAFVLALTAPTRAEVIIGLGAGFLVRFDSATPGSLLGGPTPITGLLTGQAIVGIDFRPADAALIGLGYNGTTGASNLYLINTSTGAATSFNNFTLPTALTGLGVDFNPVANALRIIANNGGNFRVTAGGAGTFNIDSSLNPGTPNVAAIAYDRNFAGATQTTLFDIDGASNMLFTQGSPNGTPTSPNTGTLFPVAPLTGVNGSTVTGFDISGHTGIAYGTTAFGGPSVFFRLNLGTGQATTMGTIGAGLTIVSIAVPEPSSFILLGVASAGLTRLVRHRRR